MARKPLNSAETIRKINEKNSLKPAKKTPWKDLPEHVQRNILRVKDAEHKRRALGHELPRVTFVSGGKVTPK